MATRIGTLVDDNTGDNIYPVTEASAVAGLAAASLFPDFDNLTPLQTIEYDVTANGIWCKLFERSNAEGTLASDVVGTIACRIIVTSSNMEDKQVIDLVCLLPGQAATTFPAFMLPKTPKRSTTGLYGIYKMSIYVPRALGSGYAWGVRFYTGTNLTRHLKIEIYKTASLVSFFTQQENSDIGSTYNALGPETTADKFRPLFNLPGDLEGNAQAANHLNGYLSSFIPVNIAVIGEALVANNICFFSTDNKLYKIGTTDVPILADAGIHMVGTNYNADQTASYTNLQQRANCSIASSSATYGTFTKGEEIYLRCHLSNGVLYSDGVLTNAVAPGYTWISVGKADSATRLALDTVGKQFFTLDANGKLTHINGREIASGGGGGLDAYVLTIDSYYINNAIDNDTTAPLTETDWVNLSEAIDAGKIIILSTDTNSHKPGLIGVQSVTLGENYGVPGYAFNDPYYRTGFSPASTAYVTPYRIYILNDYRNNQFYLKATNW